MGSTDTLGRMFPSLLQNGTQGYGLQKFNCYTENERKQMSTGSRKRSALILVEADFENKHIGVRGVIRHYSEVLNEIGFQVHFAEWQERGMVRVHPASIVSGPGRPRWSETIPAVGESSLVDPYAYSLIIVSNPWLVAGGLPPLPNCIGIAYDLVPQLIADHQLVVPRVVDTFHFAQQHDIGFRYFRHYCKAVLCISESTRNDLTRMYPDIATRVETFVDIPFGVEPRAPLADRQGESVLLIGPFDNRKNPDVIVRVLCELGDDHPGLQVRVTGRMRIPQSTVNQYLTQIRDAGIEVQWAPAATAGQLRQFFLDSAVLLFPSLYEGLGLPVLEAQQYGVPAVTSTASSLPEVNMNPDLCFQAADWESMATAMDSILRGPKAHDFLISEDLQSAVGAYLDSYGDAFMKAVELVAVAE